MMATTVPPLKIVYATPWFGSRKFVEDQKFTAKDCPIPDEFDVDTKDNYWCTLTSSRDDIKNAAGLIFHAPDMMLAELQDHAINQPWILESLETPFSTLFRADKDNMRDFDYLASYNFKSTFLFSYFSPAIMDVVNRPLPRDFMKTKTKSAPILWIARNCRATSGREKYIEKLMEYVDVHSYGNCLNNKPFPSDKSRSDLIAEYKFYLSAENSNCEDYATEKLYDTLSLSAVPIVDGPPSYNGYIPTNRSVIYMDAYPDPKDLADYINYLHNNDTAYLQYLSFRQHAIDVAPKDRLDPEFISRWNDTIAFNQKSSYCSVCRGVLPWWAYKSDPNQTLSYHDPNEGHIFLADESCSASGKWNYISNGPPYQPDWTPRPRDEFTRPNYTSQQTQSLNGSFTAIDRNQRHADEDTAFRIFVANLESKNH
ncbi:hypothetical protein [Parasitella parasitica]|uniref:Fucosyltransferase n=1 Tax=Parasitella parasitica TaxID=35722 RepID=A0A0B7NPW5_9FUNG|nr:hypothetical protein [Parasitella parasitica]